MERLIKHENSVCELDVGELEARELGACNLNFCNLDGCNLIACNLIICNLIVCNLIVCNLSHKGQRSRDLARKISWSRDSKGEAQQELICCGG